MNEAVQTILAEGGRKYEVKLMMNTKPPQQNCERFKTRLDVEHVDGKSGSE